MSFLNHLLSNKKSETAPYTVSGTGTPTTSIKTNTKRGRDKVSPEQTSSIKKDSKPSIEATKNQTLSVVSDKSDFLEAKNFLIPTKLWKE
jgi:LysM repeat protein